jgi:hypothetical protein
VDPERVRFVFGTDDPKFDVDNEDALVTYFEREFGSDDPDDDDHDDAVGPALVRTVVTRQLLRDEPPETWAAAQRLSALGLERSQVLDQLSVAVTRDIQRALTNERDGDEYLADLERLPVPAAADIVAALATVVDAQQGIALDAARDGVLARLGDARNELVEVVVESAIDECIEDGTLGILYPDRLVHPPTLTEGIVLTHRLNEGELEMGAVQWVGSDLAGFAWLTVLRTPDGDDIETFSLEYAHVGWAGPNGWLQAFAAGDLVAVRVQDGVARFERLDNEPVHDDAFSRRLRRHYDVEVSEAGLPVACADVVYSTLVEDRAAFDHTRPPLSEMCERVGLELRGALLGHDASVWYEEKRLRRTQRAYDSFDDPDLAHAVLLVVDTLDNPDAGDDDLRHALADMREGEMCELVIDQLVPVDDRDDEDADAARGITRRLVDVAHTPEQRATADFVAGIVHERSGDVLLAAVHFERALEADAEFGPAIDRVAWYASDRGDARRAADLWRMLESPDQSQLRAVEDALRRVPSRHGRNDPCWCGSGRKQKVCHGDEAEPIPLPDRVPWLGTKAVAYLFRHGGEADLDLFDLAIAHASEPDDIEEVRSALDDVAVADVALAELGWFKSFLRDRGPLLPDDEHELAARWLDVERSVYEIEAADGDDTVVLRDLRTGDRVEVRAPTRPAGQLICARPVPAGDGHQLFGAVFEVRPDDADEVLAWCANHDAFGLCGYAGKSATG